ncbi:MAG: UDP-N-acetylglucosamine 2-epimerase (non-hydrolyzing) [Acidobacteriota bacterium]|nr:UDP-N-acetylglucosamine 2-epimerase (non-hydrolyzing) [Acidobacteriota bacterium]
MKTLLVILGTRPEAIKLAPLILHLRTRPAEFRTVVCVTAQHRGMLDQVLETFRITPDYDLDLMLPGQTLFQSTSRVLACLEPVFEAVKPDIAIVQGDTTTTLCGALAAFYKNVPVAHIEAGLRSGDMRQPFPEEMNRVLASRITALHFAATEWAAGNLRAEGVAPACVFVTGNTGIDAVLHVRDALESGALIPSARVTLDAAKRTVLVTAHRRESFGPGFESICRALARLSGRGDIQIVYPVHPNPNVRGCVDRFLRGRSGVILIEPLDYVSFVDLMSRAYLLITDSGGIQEEGPSFGKPILVLREKTERPEAVTAGTVHLVGTEEALIVEEARTLLDDPAAYQAMARCHNPYGDGQASRRIADALAAFASAS